MPIGNLKRVFGKIDFLPFQFSFEALIPVWTAAASGAVRVTDHPVSLNGFLTKCFLCRAVNNISIGITHKISVCRTGFHFFFCTIDVLRGYFLLNFSGNPTLFLYDFCFSNHITIDGLYSLWKSFILSIIISALLAIVDFYNMPSSIIERFPFKIIALFLIVLFILIIFLARKYHLHKQINFCGINQFDAFLLCGEMVIIIYTLIIICFHIMKTYKACIVIILFFFAFLLIAIRIHNRKLKTENKNNTNIDLKELYDNSLSPDSS